MYSHHVMDIKGHIQDAGIDVCKTRLLQEQ
jgi:hypothetical protein